MKSIANKKIELIEKILHLSEQEVLAVDLLFKKLFSKPTAQTNQSTNLKGIWEKSGFEKIEDLDEEIALIRKELSDSILEKENKL